VEDHEKYYKLTHYWSKATPQVTLNSSMELLKASRPSPTEEKVLIISCAPAAGENGKLGLLRSPGLYPMLSGSFTMYDRLFVVEPFYWKPYNGKFVLFSLGFCYS